MILLPMPSSPAFMIFFATLYGGFGGLLVYGGLAFSGLWPMLIMGVPLVVLAVIIFVLAIRSVRKGHGWFRPMR
ncbi:hypothetical protein [Amycolatopsis saalfeldensis]|uniref:Uncharacterized protein n=1 Tax=Amycolatopsis saalfeldensis TaxID=394193 RepID=A0A1H8WFQ7_9PSEU|nr:hypothetical protein [Amycolatopsis saalfeldensis]SEP26461.1 hypothetical protein SAMN04489732_105150 [Amycolatopsis saalfeldensis]